MYTLPNLSAGICLVLLLTSCNGRKEKEINEPRTGRLYEKYQYIETDNGSQLKDGYYKKFYDNGQVQIDGFYAENLKNGEWKEYEKNGSLSLQANYLRDSLDGKYEQFFANGQKSKESNYKNNKEDGEVKEWYEDGKLALEYTRILGLMEGKNISYHPNGAKSIEGEVHKNQWDGKFTSWYNDGTQHQSGLFKSGLRIGTWVTNNSKGDLILQEEYESGKNISLVGKWRVDDGHLIEYHKNGVMTITTANEPIIKNNYSVEDGVISIGDSFGHLKGTFDKLLKNEYTLTFLDWGGARVQTVHGVRIN